MGVANIVFLGKTKQIRIQKSGVFRYEIMKNIIITTQNEAQENQIREALQAIEGIEVEEIANAEEGNPEAQGLLALAGLWQGRNINAQQLREEAWHGKEK
jgi:hypothetical protein